VPRVANGTTTFPNPNNGTGVARTLDGWPMKTTDRIVALQPILTDCNAAEGQRTANVAKLNSGGHQLNNTVVSINCTYADGHTVAVPRKRLQWQWYGTCTQFY